MKNLANCGPREFLRQTAKIRRAVEKWLTLTDIMNIRKRIPEVPDTATPQERDEAFKAQAKKNAGIILDAIMDKYPDETVDLLALCCFIEPEKADDHPMSEYLGSLTDMLDNEDVLRFFISLVKLARTLGLTE